MTYTLANREPAAECRTLLSQPALNCFSLSLITASFITSFPAFKRKGHSVIIFTTFFCQFNEFALAKIAIVLLLFISFIFFMKAFFLFFSRSIILIKEAQGSASDEKGAS